MYPRLSHCLFPLFWPAAVPCNAVQGGKLRIPTQFLGSEPILGSDADRRQNVEYVEC